MLQVEKCNNVLNVPHIRLRANSKNDLECNGSKYLLSLLIGVYTPFIYLGHFAWGGGGGVGVQGASRTGRSVRNHRHHRKARETRRALQAMLANRWCIGLIRVTLSKKNKCQQTIMALMHFQTPKGQPQREIKGFVDSGYSRHMYCGEHNFNLSVFHSSLMRLCGNWRRNKPMIEGTGPKWLFDIDSLTQSMNYVPVSAGTVSNVSAGTSEENSQDCIVMPIWKDSSYFDSPTKNVDNGTKTTDDSSKTGEEWTNDENVSTKRRFADDQQVLLDVNAVGQQVNTASLDVNTGSLELNVVGPSVSTASSNEEDNTEEEPEVDLGNITNSYIVPTTPNTRIHKDHPIDNVIGEVQSTVQTRRMLKPTSEQGFLTLSDFILGGSKTGKLCNSNLNKLGILVELPNGKEGYWNKMIPDHPQTKFFKVAKVSLWVASSPNEHGLQVQQKEDDIFISQDKYVAEILKKFNYSNVKSASTPVDLEKPLVKDGDVDDVDYVLGGEQLLNRSLGARSVGGEESVCCEAGISKEVGTPRYLSLVVPLTKVGDEAVHKELGDIMERAATTASSLEAEQDSGSGPSPKFAETHIAVAFLEKPEESDGFAEIIDFLKACSVSYALTVNPVIYTSCIEQFWATAKVQTVNGVRQLQALVDKKRVIVTKSSIRRDLHLDDAEGTDCLPTATIFEELSCMGYEKPSQKLTFYKAFFSPKWKYFIHTITQCLSAKSTAWNEFSSSMASLIICLATNQKFNLSKYIFDAMVKHLDGGVKFLLYPHFLQVFINQQLGNMSTHKKIFVNPFHTKKFFANMKRTGKDFSGRITPLFDTMMEAEVPQDEAEHEESVPTPSNDPQPSAKEIAALKKRIQRLERRKISRPTSLKRLRKVDIDADVEVTLVDETQVRQNDDLIFDTGVLDDVEMLVEAKVDGKDEQSTKTDDSIAGEAVTTAIDDSAVPTTNEEISLAQTLIQIKAAKPKVVTTAATTATTTRPKDRGVVVQEPIPLKRKDQISLDEQIARDIQAKLDAELLEEQKLARKQEEEANIALIESWENTQAMMEADRLLAERLQSKERGNRTERKAKLFMELIEKRRKHFAALRA
ncbi:hypothetical protein Tco_1133523 [Tanacetum coccineum]